MTPKSSSVSLRKTKQRTPNVARNNRRRDGRDVEHDIGHDEDPLADDAGLVALEGARCG